jgi:uncharacterized membrane protein
MEVINVEANAVKNEEHYSGCYQSQDDLQQGRHELVVVLKVKVPVVPLVRPVHDYFIAESAFMVLGTLEVPCARKKHAATEPIKKCGSHSA